MLNENQTKMKILKLTFHFGKLTYCQAENFIVSKKFIGKNSKQDKLKYINERKKFIEMYLKKTKKLGHCFFF